MSKILDSLLLPRITPETKVFFGMSSIIKSGLKYTSQEVKDRINTFFNEPIFRLSDLGKKYRTINYLEATDLINDPRDQKGKGWRTLGLSEFIYISILLELRKYGLKANQLKHFKSLYDEYSAYAIFAVLAGHEVTMIFKPNGFCAFLDPTFLGIYEEEDSFLADITPERGAGEVQLKLSYFISNALSLIGKPTPVIEYSFAKSSAMSKELERLKEYEKKLLAEVKKLKPTEADHLLIRRLKDESVLIKRGQQLPTDSDLASKLSSLIDEDFCDLTLVKRDGKAVNLELTRTEKINTD